MTFAISLEDGLAELYSAGAAALPEQAAELNARAKAAQSRAKKLERSRRGDITEITLEPIEGLEEAAYSFATEPLTAETLNAAEATARRFYADAAPKINVREARRLLERCHKDYEALSPL